MTEGERKLWSLLRKRRLGGFRFRRQVPLGPYIADFFCPQAKLVVEVDGAPHLDEEQMYRDLARTKWLEAHGCRVIRFFNIDVFKQPVEVTEAIHHALTDSRSGPSELPFRPHAAASRLRAPSPTLREGKEDQVS